MIKPMLCQDGDLKDLKRQGFAGEWKFDGTRVLVMKEKNIVTLQNRHGIIYTRRLPEIVEAAQRIPRDFTLDGEAVYINPATGQVEFTPSQRRCSTQDLGAQLYLQNLYPLTFEAFAILNLNGEDLTKYPWAEMKNLLQKFLSPVKAGPIRYVPHRYDIANFFEEVKNLGEEGIVIKRTDSRYENERSWSWLKIKNWRYEVCDVIGFTQGTNARSPFFGSLVLAKDGKFRGCVGSGFNDWELRKIKDLLDDSPKTAKPFDIGEPYTAVNVKLKVLAKYYKITESGVMRHPVFDSFAE